MAAKSTYEKYGYNKTLLDSLKDEALKGIEIISHQERPVDPIMTAFLKDFIECLRSVVSKVDIIKEYASIRGRSIYIKSSDDIELKEATAADKAKIARTLAETALDMTFEPLPEETATQ